jgi:uncharacterized protein YjbI with pentapeptide repeats
MADKGHLGILAQGAETWNQWRKEHPAVSPDLSWAHLRWADLSLADLRLADLRWANLSGANLRWANLSLAHLSLAHFSRAHLIGADLSLANLNGAHLNEADLSLANLSRANLSRADFSGAHLGRADLSGADLSFTHFRGADLSGACLELARLVETNLEEATLSGCRLYGISVWNLKLENTKQDNLIISQKDASVITVDNLEVAQFVYLLLNNADVREAIRTISTKMVLILGHFTPERKAILDAIREQLRQGGRYIPVLFDFEGPNTSDTPETIATLARLARFVIADITDPQSIPPELVSIVEAMPSLAIRPLLQSGHTPWSMYDDIKQYPGVMEIHYYKDLGDLVASLEAEVVAPAEAKATELMTR